MMTLDQRARHAAAAVHEAAAAYRPAGSVSDVARRRARGRAVGLAAAGLAVFMALVAGTWITGSKAPDAAEPSLPTPPSQDQPATTAPTKAPVVDPSTPVVADPAPRDGSSGAEGDGDGVVAAPAPVTTAPPGDARPPETTRAPDTTEAPDVTRAPDLTTAPTTAVTDIAPPRLSITSPEDGAVVEQSKVRFQGRTEPGASVAVGRFEADVTDDGRWSLVLVLSEGRNRVSFLATDGAGNETTAAVTVYYEPPPPATDPPPGGEFSAAATFGSCGEDPPYDVYYGIAEPGGKVQVSSEFGSGTTVADGNGHWEITVYFPFAPVGKTFFVTAQDTLGNSKKFEFTRLASG